MHSGLNITIALTIAESASWRAVGNPEIMAKVLVNAETGKVDFPPYSAKYPRPFLVFSN